MNKEVLLKNKIPVSEVLEEIEGSDGIILKTLVSGEIIYFKFLPKNQKEKVQREIEVVEKVKEKYDKIPDYYKCNGKRIFSSGEQIFYGTKEVSGNPATNEISKSLLIDIMKELARMHKVLRMIPTREIDCDYNRLREFYENHKEFFMSQNLQSFIEKVLELKPEEKESTYIHADINFKNIFVENNKVKSFIDWTDIRIGYLEDDLGKLFQNIYYLDLSEEEIEELISIYEKELGEKISRKDFLISLVYRMMYRYYGFVQNQEGNIEEYKGKTKKILQKIIER